MTFLRILLGFTAATILTSVACANKSSSSNDGSLKTCRGGQALQAIGLRGSSMPAKSLALTFDDGPGARTKQLSTFLKNNGIRAAFFVNGRSMGTDGPEVLAHLVADGHLVGNHTETHRSLTGTSTATTRLTDPEVIQELADTDTKIEKFMTGGRFLFRPPFGDYDEQTITTLTSSAMSKYVGPVLWDVGDRMDEASGRVADWDCWQDGSDAKRTPMETCGNLYINAIEQATRGIVLLHDPYFNELDPNQQGTVDMVMYMVPILKERGFTFMRVDEVPEIAQLLPALPGDPDSGAPPGSDPAATGPNPEDPCK